MYKKILTISLLIIILMSIFSVNCYASTDFNYNFTDKGFDYPDFSFSGCSYEPKYFFLVNMGDYTDITFYFTENPLVIESREGSKGLYLKFRKWLCRLG